MSTSKNFDKLCVAVISLLVAFTLIVMACSPAGSSSKAKSMAYENRLFDTSRVHTINIVMDNWDEFIENCESEEYSPATVVIDNEKISNVGLRAKGNTSLTNVKSLNSQRYSLKIEFDQYEKGKNYYGLDKLCLNNLIQDNTMMKDYLVYQMMNEFGVDSPLCSYVYVTVNNQDWGLFLAVEGLEDSFLQRTQGSDTGDLYKPDSMSFGGGQGNGQDFRMSQFDFGNDAETEKTESNSDDSASKPSAADTNTSASFNQNSSESGSQTRQRPDSMSQNPPSDMGGSPQNPMQQPPNDNFDPFAEQTQSSAGPNESNSPTIPTDPQNSSDQKSEGSAEFGQGANPVPNGAGMEDASQPPEMPQMQDGNQPGQGQGGPGGGMGSDDVKLKYIDDDPESYSNIFSSAKTDVSEADQKRLISSLKNLSEYSNLENTLEIDKVLRYFVVHNFVSNGDSYTGSMIHNYYLHEKDGLLSMIPWDYNLAFGTFQSNQASSVINESIDNPISGSSADDRPMFGWILSNESYLNQYHEVFREFVQKYYAEGKLQTMIEETASLIRPYVEKDPTKFCTLEEFDKGVEAISEFVSLRMQAVQQQLDGDTSQVDASNLNLSDMGTMNNGMGKQGGKEMPSGNRMTSDFDLTRFASLTDADGQAVDLSSLLSEGASLKSLTFKDGSSLDLVNPDFPSLQEKDFSQAVSAVDSNGNEIDLSKYTISLNMPSPSGMNGSSDQKGQPAQRSSRQESANPQQTPSNDQNESSKPMQEQNSQTESNPAEPPQNPGGDTADSFMNNAKGSKEVPSGKNISEPGQVPGQASNPLSNLVLLAGSSVILLLGLVIAIKKKF